jgi:hypothetical protein
MELHKVKIFPKNEDFLNEIIDFLIENSKVFKREFSINNILNESHSPPHLIEKLSPILLDEKHGSTFQSYYRYNRTSYISHTIHSISIDEDNYYANIELWRLAHNDLMILRPVYYKNNEDRYCIGTFDLDYDITHNRA